MECGPYRRFGVRMRQWREQEKLTARQLAKKISASDTYLLEQERGAKPPTDPRSVIGQALCAMMGDQPTLHERFLWSQWSTNAFSLLQLAVAVLRIYAPHREIPDDLAIHPRTLAELVLPPAIDTTELVQALGGVGVNLDEVLGRSREMSGGIFVDWLLQTTFQLGYRFMPFNDEVTAEKESVNARARDMEMGLEFWKSEHPSSANTTALLVANLRYPVEQSESFTHARDWVESVSVPYSFE